MNLRAKSLAATASLILVTGLGAFAPVQAKPDCDKTPDAPICGGEPKPKPKPQQYQHHRRIHQASELQTISAES